jgi:hypothetical protein
MGWSRFIHGPVPTGIGAAFEEHIRYYLLEVFDAVAFLLHKDHRK